MYKTSQIIDTIKMMNKGFLSCCHVLQLIVRIAVKVNVINALTQFISRTDTVSDIQLFLYQVEALENFNKQMGILKITV